MFATQLPWQPPSAAGHPDAPMMTMASSQQMLLTYCSVIPPPGAS